MAIIHVPPGTLKRPPQLFSCELLEQAINDFPLLEPDFTGFIAIGTQDVLYLLFFFNGAPYSAGKSIGEKPFSLTLHDFLRDVAGLNGTDAELSVHATDPVLLKCLLVFIQDDPAVKAPASLINLESVLAQIRQAAANALIILEKQGMFNFFFFKDGVTGKAYYSDSAFSEEANVPIDEQVLVYAFQGGDVSVDALIYRDLATHESPDAGRLAPEEISRLLGTDADKTCIFQAFEALAEVRHVACPLELAVCEGPLKGQTFKTPIPCVIGRKDTDLVIPDPMISKTHAVFQIVNGSLLLLDLNSTNGTFVNGEAVKKHVVAVGDLIGIGGTQLKVLQITNA